MTTFSDLGVPFPLFEAPVTEAAGYAGLSTCRLCDTGGQHCFVLDIGCAVVRPCPACGLENGLDARDRRDGPCRSCGSTVPFPDPLKHLKNIHICHACLRAGRGAISKDTEFGMVSWEQAFRGVTHGAPGLTTDEFERVPVDPAEDWYGVRVPPEHLFELLRTPAFHTWQGECWLFCCRRPMVYIGEWAAVVAARFCGADPEDAFYRVFDPDDPSKEEVWDRLAGRTRDAVCVYVYRCQTCDRFRSTWDTD